MISTLYDIFRFFYFGIQYLPIYFMRSAQDSSFLRNATPCMGYTYYLGSVRYQYNFQVNIPRKWNKEQNWGMTTHICLVLPIYADSCSPNRKLHSCWIQLKFIINDSEDFHWAFVEILPQSCIYLQVFQCVPTLFNVHVSCSKKYHYEAAWTNSRTTWLWQTIYMARDVDLKI